MKFYKIEYCMDLDMYKVSLRKWLFWLEFVSYNKTLKEAQLDVLERRILERDVLVDSQVYPSSPKKGDRFKGKHGWVMYTGYGWAQYRACKKCDLVETGSRAMFTLCSECSFEGMIRIK